MAWDEALAAQVRGTGSSKRGRVSKHEEFHDTGHGEGEGMPEPEEDAVSAEGREACRDLKKGKSRA